MQPIALGQPVTRCAGSAHQRERSAGMPPGGPGEEFDLLFAATSDGVLLLGPGGAVERANPAVAELLGAQPGQLGRVTAVRTLLAPRDHRVEPLIAELRRAGKAAGTVTALRVDGTPVDVQVRMTQYPGAAGEPRVIVVLRPAAPSASSPGSAPVSPRQLPVSVAHDLQAPLGTLAGFARALDRVLGPEASPRSRHYVERILAAVGQLEGHMEALLSSARIAHAPLAVRRVDLSGAARRILRDLQLRDLDRIVSVQVQDGICAGGDPHLLTVLLDNLLANAWKFTGRRAEASISFTAQAAPDGEVVYQVRDDGAGFDMAHAGKLFRDFQRLHSQAEFPGTGIGLANVQRVVERHGGRIWAESAPGRGATFSFTLGTCAAAGCVPCQYGLEPPVRDEVSA